MRITALEAAALAELCEVAEARGMKVFVGMGAFLVAEGEKPPRAFEKTTLENIKRATETLEKISKL